MGKYQTAPPAITTVPRGIPYIVANEAAERFSFYGMRGILFVFMTQYLLDRAGKRDPMSPSEATGYQHLFMSAAYFTPLIGSIISDAFLGKYLTIMSLSLVYCLGHLALALDDTRMGLAIGLTLIAIGSGGIKPCVSAHVGDQFGSLNKHLLSRVFGWFYFSINFGSFFSMLLTPVLLREVGPSWAFGVPGILMFLATLFFWMGRNVFVHIPPAGREFVKETFGIQGIKSILHLVKIYVFVTVFWSLYDQTSSKWVEQANSMDRVWLGHEWLPDQVQAVNPLLILVFIPLFSYVIYPLVDRVFRLTPLRKLGIGFFLTVPSFLIPAWIEHRIEAGEHPSIAWQILCYIIITAAEVCVSITSLEFSYTQAPKKMKSLVMGLYMLSVSMGNAFTSVVNFLIEGKNGAMKISGHSYYLFFSGLMLVAAFAFIFVAMTYRGKTYLQDDADSGGEAPASG